MKALNRTLAGLIIGFAALLVTSVVAASSHSEDPNFRDFSKMPVSGTVTFDITSVKLIAGASWGSGTLSYQGKDYPIKVKSLSAGGIGIRSMEGEGKIYELNRLEDFPGVYGGGAAGLTAGTAGGGVATIENNSGVVIQLSVTDSKGLQLALSAGGIQIEFADE